MAGRVGKLAASTARFFLCDMQGKFRDNIVHFPAILEVNRRLVRRLCCFLFLVLQWGGFFFQVVVDVEVVDAASFIRLRRLAP